jgi:hypothetical protein
MAGSLFTGPKCEFLSRLETTVANQLIPPAGMEHAIPNHLTPDQRAAVWADLMDASEEFLLAGLSRQVGPDGDLREAYRCWYARQMEEHDRAMRQMAESLYRRGVRHGR